MAKLVRGKWNLNWKSIAEKYKIFKVAEQGTTCDEIVRKYGIAMQTIPNWIKDKNKIYATVETNKTSSKHHCFKTKSSMRIFCVTTAKFFCIFLCYSVRKLSYFSAKQYEDFIGFSPHKTM